MTRVMVATGGGAVGSYSMLIFTGWDYGLQGERATKLKQNNLRYHLQVRGGKLADTLGYDPAFQTSAEI